MIHTFVFRKKRAAADKPSVHSDQEPGQGQNDVMDELLVGGDLIDMEEDSLSELTTLEELSQRDRFSDEWKIPILWVNGKNKTSLFTYEWKKQQMSLFI